MLSNCISEALALTPPIDVHLMHLNYPQQMHIFLPLLFFPRWLYLRFSGALWECFETLDVQVQQFKLSARWVSLRHSCASSSIPTSYSPECSNSPSWRGLCGRFLFVFCPLAVPCLSLIHSASLPDWSHYSLSQACVKIEKRWNNINGIRSYGGERRTDSEKAAK